jgi:hypothetical protein
MSRKTIQLALTLALAASPSLASAQRLPPLPGLVPFPAPPTPTLALTWSYAGAVPGQHCVSFNEPSDPDTWSDNFLCGATNYGFAFSNAGPIPGQHCVALLETADPHTWTDNYLCSVADYGARWSSAGPIPGAACIQINEPADRHTWDDNYLCFDKARVTIPDLPGKAVSFWSGVDRSVGDDAMGASFRAGVNLSADSRVPRAAVSAEASATARLFGRHFDALRLAGQVKADRTQAEASIQAYVAGQQLIPLTTFRTSYIDTIPFGGEPQYVEIARGEKSMIIQVGPIPVQVTVEGVMSGAAGATGTIRLGALNASLEAEPYLSVKATGSAAAQVLIARAWVEGDMNVLDVRVPLAGGINVIGAFTGQPIYYSLGGTAYVAALGGELRVCAGVSLPFLPPLAACQPVASWRDAEVAIPFAFAGSGRI